MTLEKAAAACMPIYLQSVSESGQFCKFFSVFCPLFFLGCRYTGIDMKGSW